MLKVFFLTFLLSVAAKGNSDCPTGYANLATPLPPPSPNLLLSAPRRQTTIMKKNEFLTSFWPSGADGKERSQKLESLRQFLVKGGQEAEEGISLLYKQEELDKINEIAGLSSLVEQRRKLEDFRREVSEKIFRRDQRRPSVSPDRVRARREEPLTTNPGYKTYKVSTEEVLKIRREYPGLAANIDEATSKIEALTLMNPRKAGLYFSKVMNQERVIRLRKNPVIHRAALAVWESMNDSRKMADYVRTLAEDAAVEMKMSGTARELDALTRGELTREAVLKVLVKRHRAQGNDRFSVIVSDRAYVKPSSSTRKTKAPVDFRAAVGQGPFFDKPFDGVRHGVDTHFLQIDYASTAVWDATEGEPKKFWDYLGSSAGINFWVPLFDSFNLQNPTFARPEYLAHKISGLLKISD